MTKSQQKLDEQDAMEAQMIDRIEELIEQVILETVCGFLNRMVERKKNRQPPVCYRLNCKDRDEIPF